MTEHRIRNADAPLSLSIVIPTHNRRESLGRTLTALSGQTVPVSDFEVVVVADGCHDGTTTFVRELSLGLELQVVELPGLGAAAARNRGAAATRGEILVFLDDDIEPFPNLLASYLDEHVRAPGRLLIGRTQPVIEPKTFYEAELRRWWFDHILTMRRRSHRFGYRDLHAGNFSIASRVFAAVKGFDESFPGCGGEDYELGMRLLAAGVDFSYCHQAGGYHYDDTNLERSLLRAFQEGRADVLTAQKHPELIPGLRLHGIVVGQNPIAHLANRLGLDRLQALWLKHWTGLLDRAHLRRRAVNSYVRLRASCYRRGVEAQLGSMNRLQQLLASCSPELTKHPGIADVDLRHGLVTARRQLETQRPNGARLRFGAVKVATIPPTPGMEPLRACHLEEALKASPLLLSSLAVEAAQSPRFVSEWLVQADTHDPCASVLLPSDPPSPTGNHLGQRRSKPDEPGRGSVCQLDLAEPISNLALSAPSSFVRLLVRSQSRPIGWVQVQTEGAAQVDAEQLRTAIIGQVGWPLTSRTLLGSESPCSTPSVFPPISVIVCTRDRPGEIEDCLTALASLKYPSYEVLVVDNASIDERTAAVAARFGVRYVRESRPGLDWARNRGIRESRYSIIAFIDDDARADPNWLSALARAFEDCQVDAVTGLVAPLELETEAQQLYEFAYGGMGKGFESRHLHRSLLGPDQLLRVQDYGVGTNMAFRRTVFEGVGDFDPALDVGTAARGGGDLDMFHRVIVGGHLLLYEPGAVVWHRHRRTLDELKKQLYDDGRAFTIYLMKVSRVGTIKRRHVLSFTMRNWIPWLVGRLGRGLVGRERLPLDMLWAPIRGVLSAPSAGRRARQTARQTALPGASQPELTPQSAARL